MSGNGALGGEMDFENEIPEFAGAVRAALIAPVEPASPEFVRRLAAEAVTPATAVAHADRPARAPQGLRIARVAVAFALLPLVTASLAIAGVKLPGPANEAFESIGIELPNQAADDGDDRAAPPAGGPDRPAAEQGKPADPGAGGRANADDKRGHGKDKSNPAREGGRAQGTQGKGRALGKRGLAPGQTKPKDSNGGGSGQGKAVGKSDEPPPGQAKEPSGKGSEGGGKSESPGSGNGAGNGKSK